MNSPVLFLVFNRPETTRQVFAAIREAQPARLYVAGDGPRADQPDDRARVEAARSIASAVDWPCQVGTLFHQTNQGCKKAVSSAISWFFENEPEGIILEDDVLPLPSFFSYCDELLERFREQDDISMISGCNLVSRHIEIGDSYAFSLFTHVWGWASWRDRWDQYDVQMRQWPAWRQQGGLSELCGGDRLFIEHWQDLFARTHAGEIDTWDFQWTFACWLNGWLSVLPEHNLTQNLGFTDQATHTVSKPPAYVQESVPRALEFPLRHPAKKQRNRALDKAIAEHVFSINQRTRLLRRIRRIPGLRTLSKTLGQMSRYVRS